MKFAVFLFFSSCVDESQLCRGMGLCTNNEDLEWCQNGQRILTSVKNESLPYKNSWKPLFDHTECTLPNSKRTQTERPIEKKIGGHSCLLFPKLCRDGNIVSPLLKETKVLTPYAKELLSSHQQIETAKKGDGLAYHCFNRADETPFHKAINTDALEKIENNWIELVNTPCESPYERRCLGKAAKECTRK